MADKTFTTSEELDRIEELVRYLADHDGRLPTDDLPLAWWLIDVFDAEQNDAVRRVLAEISIRQPGRGLTPKKAHAWSTWLARREQLVWADRRGQTLEEAVARDKPLRDWVNEMLSRHLTGSLGVIETGLLARTPLWDFDRQPDTRSSRKETVFKIGLDAVRAFYLEHKHSDIPEGHIVSGIDVQAWWALTRVHYASGVLKDHHRIRMDKLGNLGVDLRTDKERTKTQRQAAEAARKEAEREVRRRQLAEQRGIEDVGPVLDAIRSFAERHGHTGIPVGATTEEGVPFGRLVDRWRRQGRVDRTLRRALDGIPGWVWLRSPGLPKIHRPAPVAIPEDTTQMNRSGLRQFLPAD